MEAITLALPLLGLHLQRAGLSCQGPLDAIVVRFAQHKCLRGKEE